jgi:ribosome biogenesis GTPase A
MPAREVAAYLGALLIAHYPDGLAKRYRIDPAAHDGIGLVEAVAEKRGCHVRGRTGELDLEKAAMILLTDYRDGKLGRITLETPNSRAAILKNGASHAD